VTALGCAGCLLERGIVPPDAELTPLMPPAILTDETEPRPGSMVVLGSDETIQRFRVELAYEPANVLFYRFFIDRPRPCTASLIQCLPIEAKGMLAAPEEGGILRTVDVTLSFPERGRCYRVDLYISPEFQFDSFVQHLPVRKGEVAHVRWFVVR